MCHCNLHLIIPLSNYSFLQSSHLLIKWS
uniref:Uncharacterized protein n=1 Tax=Arundo donax TaxID=35708 RepID=A0A0A9CCT8_ARUDO